MAELALATAVQAVAAAAHPLTGRADQWDPLLELIGEAPFVLLGEASHGSHEFYHARAQISRRLIEEKGFAAVAVEADWPDAYRVNRFVQGVGPDQFAEQALEDFTRFPRWMWRNQEVLAFVRWLRDRNRRRPPHERAGFYGLDLYSLYTSIAAVIAYLEGEDPDAARRARERYGCFDHLGDDPQHYGHQVHLGLKRHCRDQAVDQLVELRRRSSERLRAQGMPADDEAFFAEQNARLVRNAEEYYREMFGYRVNTWNLRDRHMAETLAALAGHLDRPGRPAKIAVWEHNSHIGDARATEAQARGELNVGQLARERYREQAVLVGFTTYHGSVAAASEWDAPVEHKRVRPALPGSYEDLLHQAGPRRFFLSLRGRDLPELHEPRLERMIGVIYRPETERQSHYFHCRLAEQFDAVIHFDHTRAVEPLDPPKVWAVTETPETYPFGT